VISILALRSESGRKRVKKKEKGRKSQDKGYKDPNISIVF